MKALDRLRALFQRKPKRTPKPHGMRALLAEALDLVPRMSDDDPIAPALADWCKRVRAVLAKGKP